MKTEKKKILSLFCGCGGLDLGFEQAGFKTALAYDCRPDAISSWNRNRRSKVARQFNIRDLKLATLDEHFKAEFRPSGVIGGPPCQGFSIANKNGSSNDPRNELISIFFDIALEIDQRHPLEFIVMENVPNIRGSRGGGKLAAVIEMLRIRNFSVSCQVLDAADFRVPQRRKRLFLVATKNNTQQEFCWPEPSSMKPRQTVREAIEAYPEPTIYSRGCKPMDNPFHENHWCMAPKSSKFFDGSLVEGFTERRSFKTLWWDQPSYTAAYGNREVHVHPSAGRRLSVFEAMTLQGFPKEFVLNGSMSSQITQVSEAVPPPLAKAVAQAVFKLYRKDYSPAL